MSECRGDQCSCHKKKSLSLAVGLAMLYSMRVTPDADDKIINPPQSEETKQLLIKRAEEKRQRKRFARTIIS